MTVTISTRKCMNLVQFHAGSFVWAEGWWLLTSDVHVMYRRKWTNSQNGSASCQHCTTFASHGLSIAAPSV